MRPPLTQKLSILAVALLMNVTGCMLFAKPPQDLDYGRTRTSTNGLYRGTVRTAGDSIPQGKLHSWTLQLFDAKGAAVNEARITIDGGMPQHGHGLPTRPRVTKNLGNGEHLVEGMKFNMGGWWVVKFRIVAAAGNDSLIFNIKL